MFLEKCVESLKNSGWDYIKYPITTGISLDKYIENTALTYYEATRLIMCLGIQLSLLHSFNQSLYFLSPKNILKINQDWFLIQNLTTIVPTIDEQSILIEEPILDNKRYIAPELHKIFSLPHKTNISCIYYTIALLVKDAMKINEPLSISNIANSSLYYFLERCMIKEPSLRKYLFI